jgi:putative endonuclease
MKLNINNAGLEAEKLAATFLASKGLKLVAQNYHCRFGEIDLIMTDANCLVFVEVKLRSSSQFGGAAASITPQKQQKMTLAAQHYLQQAQSKNQFKTEPACRFDAILMTGQILKNTDLQQIEWIRNAFET